MTAMLVIKAILGLKKTQYSLLNELADFIVEKGIYFETTLFTTPSVAKIDFTAQLKLAVDAQALAEKGLNFPDRNLQCGLLYKLLKKLLLYTNGLYEDDEVKLLKSGFPTNKPPTAHQIPPRPVIKKVVKGAEANTAKVMLEELTGPENEKQETRMYTVKASEKADGTDPKTVHTGTDSRNLIVKNVVVMKTFWYTVSATNSAGESETASSVKFTLTD